MIRKYKVLFLIMFIVLLMSLQFVDARVKPKKPLSGKIITVDPGHEEEMLVLVIRAFMKKILI